MVNDLPAPPAVPRRTPARSLLITTVAMPITGFAPSRVGGRRSDVTRSSTPRPRPAPASSPSADGY
ncbi:hypothetical protein [Streptomyces sp. NPDC058989]|uniref:hypothetical protein n=1 Tax=Streptomyces sp. NPDC058989 TaxID=3346686 RepID=UPI0036B80B9A